MSSRVVSVEKVLPAFSVASVRVSSAKVGLSCPLFCLSSTGGFGVFLPQETSVPVRARANAPRRSGASVLLIALLLIREFCQRSEG